MTKSSWPILADHAVVVELQIAVAETDSFCMDCMNVSLEFHKTQDKCDTMAEVAETLFRNNMNPASGVQKRLKIAIPRQKLVGLIDSGANVNVIKQQYLDRNRIQYQRERNPTVAYDFTGKPHRMVGTVDLELFKGNKTRFNVAKQISGEGSHECILGTPFLNQVGVMDAISNKLNEVSNDDVHVLNE